MIWQDTSTGQRLGLVVLEEGVVREAHYRQGWPVADAAPVGSVAYGMLRRDGETGTSTPVPWGVA